jgi:hypothetical protein
MLPLCILELFAAMAIGCFFVSLKELTIWIRGSLKRATALLLLSMFCPKLTVGLKQNAIMIIVVLNK